MTQTDRYNMFLGWKNQYITEIEQKFHNLYGSNKDPEESKQS